MTALSTTPQRPHAVMESTRVVQHLRTVVILENLKPSRGRDACYIKNTPLPPLCRLKV
jgi:hypothetical protein